MKKLAELIATLPNSIQLEGHTDSIPIHNVRFQEQLGAFLRPRHRGAGNLMRNVSTDRQRFSVVGRADTLPIDTNETPEGRARNRRVDVVILNSLRVQPDGRPAASRSAGRPPGLPGGRRTFDGSSGVQK